MGGSHAKLHKKVRQAEQDTDNLEKRMRNKKKKSSKKRNTSHEHHNGRALYNGNGTTPVKVQTRNGEPKERSKFQSCPDVGPSTTPYSDDENSTNNIRLTYYRSYGNLEEFMAEKLRQSRPDVRIYRRSTGALSDEARTSDHRLVRTRSADRANPSVTSNGIPRNLDLWKGKSSSLERGQALNTETTFSSLSGADSIASMHEFPSVEEICRKVKLFEESFCHSLAFKYGSMESNVQLSKLCVARCSDRDVSFSQYIQEVDTIPEDLECVGGYFITIPRALYALLVHTRRTGVQDSKVWRSLTKDIVDSIAFEVGKELSRMYEYQIVMLKEFVAIKLLAAHAADCILEYILQKHALLERNAALRGVISERPPRPQYGTTRFSVILGDREMKWDLFEVLKLPGVRKDYGLFEPVDASTPDIYHYAGWRYFICHQNCNPSMYGYRGQLLEWDYLRKLYRLHIGEKLYKQEVEFHPNDLHQHYQPFHRLVSQEPMMRYLEAVMEKGNAQGSSFEWYMKDCFGQQASRDEFFVYRPMSPLPAQLSWQEAVLDNMDLTRLHVDDFACRRLKRSCLCYSSISNLHPDGSNTDGCDMSYSMFSGQSAEALPRRRCRLTYVALLDPEIPDGLLVTDSEGQFARLIQEVGRRSTLTEADLKSPSISPQEADLLEARALQLTGAARRVSAERISLDSAKRRNKYRRARLKQNSTSEGANLHSVSFQSSGSNSDYTLLDTPVRGEYLPQRNVYVSQPILTRSPSRDSSISPRPSPRKMVDRFEKSYSLDSRQRGQRPPMSIDSNVIVHSSDRPYPDVTLRRPNGRARIKRLQQSELDMEAMLNPLHSVKGVPGAMLLDKVVSKLPQQHGRCREMELLTDALVNPNDLIIVSGCPGSGKSHVVLNSAHIQSTRDSVTAVLVDCRCCQNMSRVYTRMVKQLGLRFQQKDIGMLTSWLAASHEKVIIILDNLDLPVSEDHNISDFINVICRIENIQVVCTTRRKFFMGSIEPRELHLGDLGGDASDLLRELVIDLPDASLAELTLACGNIPYAVKLVGQALRLTDDAGVLYASVVQLLDVDNERETWEHVMKAYKGDGAAYIPRLLSVINTVLDSFSASTVTLLRKLCVFDSLFEISTAKAVLKDEILEDVLETYVAEHWTDELLELFTDGVHWSVPYLVRLVLSLEPNDIDGLPFAMHAQNVDTLTMLCRTYHSKDSFKGLSSYWEHYDSITDCLLYFTESPFAEVKSLLPLCNPKMCIFLFEALATSDFVRFFENMTTVAQESQNEYLECSAQCCLAYHALQNDEYDDAFVYSENASTLPYSDNVEYAVMQAFCTWCLGKACWFTKEDRSQGLNIVRQALESLKVLLGLQNPLSVYVYEEYALMEKEREHFQKARYYYNLIDFVAEDVLGQHPGLLHGFDSRRDIWERQGLFSRAAVVAGKAAAIAQRFYGEHPLTASMYSRWCECLIKSGDSTEAVKSAIYAVNIREKLLGVHLQTALSNKMLAYLMLRIGRYAIATKHAQRAFDMCQKLQVHRRFVKDIEIMLGQAQRRQDFAETNYVKLETHRYSKSMEDVLDAPEKPRKKHTQTISTEV